MQMPGSFNMIDGSLQTLQPIMDINQLPAFRDDPEMEENEKHN